MNYEYVDSVLVALKNEIQQLTPEEYDKPLELLSNSSFGGHTRHIIEMFHCLELGYADGIVNYDKRKRDMNIQTKPDVAIENIDYILETVRRVDKPLTLQSLFFNDNTIESSYDRELKYCVEHCIHHQALLKVALSLLKKDIDADFGVAPSTLAYRKKQNVHS